MRIVNLVEDTEGSRGCAFEHGLSFYIETEKHRLLLDTGATDAFIHNAERLGVDLSAVDSVIISHGHYDHAGGVLPLAHLNPHAPVYIHEKAFGDFYSIKNGTQKYIGMDKRIADLENVKLLSGNTVLDGELSLFTVDVKVHPILFGKGVLFEEKCGTKSEDTFEHEMYLVISCGDKRVLLSGCAHNNILNILSAYRDLYGSDPTHVISGFHMVSQGYGEEEDRQIMAVAETLCDMNTKFYTGHCTGEHAIEILKPIMGDKLSVLHSGEELVT